MRELCVEEIAMSTRVALPMFLGCRMSELRRQLLPSPTPNQDRTAQVRKNLFGPIDHDENLKFVHDELNKISEEDSKRWNFDFQSEKPKEGRFSWQRVGDGVPQAYEMPRLTYLTTHATNTTTIAAPTPLHKVPEGVCGSSSSASTSGASLDHQQPSTSTAQTTTTTTTPSTTATTTTTTVPDTTTTTTTTTPSKTTTAKTRLPPPPTTTIPASSASCSEAPATIREVVVVKKCTSSSGGDGGGGEEVRENNTNTPKVRFTRSKGGQPPVTAFMRIRKSKRPANTKLEEEAELPALVKRPKTTSS
ncbi:endochitinase A-like [Homarus americanus]|uniref:endochitinase A-like n=1 Tax=Homarus americanus TaxID=6706 RepID=UPI001C44F689|nr:endochitinase A-like [Homarus americanus]